MSMKVAKSSWVAALGLSAFACSAEPGKLEVLPPVVPEVPETPIETTKNTLASCEPVQLWLKPTNYYGWLPSAPEFSPNGGLVTRGEAIYFEGTVYFRVTNGDVVAEVPRDFGSRDKAWERGVKVTDEGELRVETLFEGSVLFSMEATRWTHWASISPSGEKMAVLSCSETSAIVDVISLPFDVERKQVVLSDPCEDAWVEAGGRVTMLDDRFAVLATKTRMHLLDFDNMSSRETQTMDTILSFTFDSAREELAVVTGAGKLLVFSATEMSLLREDVVPLVELNRNIYAPHVFASPLAFSSDGRLFAHLDEAGELVLDRRDGSGIHARIPRVDGRMPWDENELQLESVAAASFSPDNKLLAVAYEHNFALYGCEAVAQDEKPRIVVRLDGPGTARIGEIVLFTATDLEGRDFHGHLFSVDGEPVGKPGAARDFEWTPETAGKHTISVKIDDGLRTGETSIDVFVD
jgi:hypothetical protein